MFLPAIGHFVPLVRHPSLGKRVWEGTWWMLKKCYVKLNLADWNIHSRTEGFNKAQKMMQYSPEPTGVQIIRLSTLWCADCIDCSRQGQINLINYAKRTRDVASVQNRIELGRMGVIEREGLVMKTFLSEQSSNHLSTQKSEGLTFKRVQLHLLQSWTEVMHL